MRPFNDVHSLLRRLRRSHVYIGILLVNEEEKIRISLFTTTEPTNKIEIHSRNVNGMLLRRSHVYIGILLVNEEEK